MIDHESIKTIEVANNPKPFVALALLFAEIEGTELLSLAVLKHPEVQEQYARISALCDHERARRSVQKKFESFMETLSEEERESLKSVKVPQW
jgi:hypothetical protein